MTYPEALEWLIREGVEIQGSARDATSELVLRRHHVTVSARFDGTSRDDWERGFVGLVRRLAGELTPRRSSSSVWPDEPATQPG